MLIRQVAPRLWSILAVGFCTALTARADEPKATPENTIVVQLAEPVKPQSFSRPLKFFVADVIDRSGNPQPMMVFKPRGGIFLDRTPSEITRSGLQACLQSADMLAADRASADFLLTVYLFNFGLSDSSSRMDFFGKVELAVTVKSLKTAKSQQITASGTSIGGIAVRKKNLQKNVQEDIQHAFSDALRNLLRGVKLRDAIAALDVPGDLPAAAAPPPAAAPPVPEKPPDTTESQTAPYSKGA